MKKIIATIMIVLLSCCVANADWALYGLGNFDPEESETYDHGVSAELQKRFDVSEGLDLGISFGIGQMKFEPSREGSKCFNEKVSGDVTDFAIGVGLIRELISGDSGKLSLEGGIKHHLLSSDVDVDRHSRKGSSTRELEFDNLTTAGIGLNLELDVMKDLAFLIGLGYQFDLAKEDVKLDGEKTGLMNGFEGVIFKFGAVFRR